MTGADLIAEQLLLLGVRHVFGVGGANIEDLFAAIQRRRPRIRATLCKHEHNAGTAADAYARISREFGVVMTTSGGAAMNVVPALAEAYASRVPVLALVGEPPRPLQGHGAFQDTSGQGGTVDAAKVFGSVSHFCERATDPSLLPKLVRDAVEIALRERGPAVLLIAKDVQQRSAAPGNVEAIRNPAQAELVGIDAATLAEARAALETRPITIIAGEEVARADAVDALAAFAEAFDARVCVTPDGKDAFDNWSPRFLGVVGAMGHAPVHAALSEAAVVVLAGTRLPLLSRLGIEAVLQEKPVVCFAREYPFVTFRHMVHVSGTLCASLKQLTHAVASLSKQGEFRDTRVDMPANAAPAPQAPLDLGSTMQIIERALPENSVVLVDAGNTGAGGAHDIKCPRYGRWLMAMGMAGMGYTFGAAIGAARASGARCTVVSGDGAFFMHGLEIHTAVEHNLPITYLLVDNHAHGMCLVREHLLLGRSFGYNTFRSSKIADGLGAMLPGLFARACRTQAELTRAFSDLRSHTGPAVLCAELDEVDIPPFAGLAGERHRGLSSVSRSE